MCTYVLLQVRQLSKLQAKEKNSEKQKIKQYKTKCSHLYKAIYIYCHEYIFRNRLQCCSKKKITVQKKYKILIIVFKSHFIITPLIVAKYCLSMLISFATRTQQLFLLLQLQYFTPYFTLNVNSLFAILDKHKTSVALLPKQ